MPRPHPPPEATEAPRPARQRWRLVLARSADAPEISADGSWRTPGRRRSRRPGCRSSCRRAGRGRGSRSAAPVSAGLVAEAELADIVLTELVPAWRVREALQACVPAGWRLVDLYDVWLGGPALAGQVVAADYRIELVRGGGGRHRAGRGGDPRAPTLAARAPEGRRDRHATTCGRCWSTSARRRGSAGRRPCPDAVPPGARHRPAGGGRRGARRDAGRRRSVVGSVVRERLILADEASRRPPRGRD